MQIDNEGRDSDQDEGFVANVPEINEKEKAAGSWGSQARPNDYQARYISAHGLIK